MSRADDFRPLDWVSNNIQRSEAQQWWDAGFSLNEALRWLERFAVEEARAWRDADVRTPAEARSWRVAGVGPAEVGGWREAGIGFAEASAWREFGYELDEARPLKAEGKTPSDSYRSRVQKMRSTANPAGVRLSARSTSYPSSLGPAGAAPRQPARRFVEKVQARGPNNGRVIHGYLQRQWFDDEAIEWASAGFDVADASIWKEFGVSPAEAEQLVKAGQTAAGTMRAWWGAGIPVDEVSAWLGAGFTPEEAAEQRGQGVTAERAAVLRALRDPRDQA